MVLQFVFQIILLLLPIHALAQPSSLARPNCTQRCGNLTNIPFPFGIGGGCYLDEWFEIVCNTASNGTSRAFLKRTNLEVLNISVEGQIWMRYPIFYWNCEGMGSPGVSFEGSPFVFNQPKNRFFAVGCNNLALMKQNLSTVGGCMSICDHDSNLSQKTCNGLNCCQTTIPMNLNVFNATFEGLDAGKEVDERCMFAFLVEQQWFESNFANRFIYFVKDMAYVPVVLDWTIYDQTIEALKMNNSTADNSTFKCFNYGSVLRCSCEQGFGGNPYLGEGCQDINECLSSLYPCNNNSRCVNSYGSYGCYIIEPKNSRVKVVVLGIGAGLGLLFLVFGAFGLHKAIKKRKDTKLKEKFFKRNGGLLLQQQLSTGEVNVEKTKLFNSKELEKATDNYNENRILGQGGQGTVYKGMLADGKIVAVKKSKIVDEGKLEQFINEVVILSQIIHRNVVKLLGCCLETEVPLLVYEFIPNGTLFQYIHNQDEEILLPWEMRLRIATEIAGALSYLHSSASIPIYHRDIKSTNILLDDKYRAKVSDFGTSKSVSIDQTHLTTVVQGTFGYLDPEYFQTSQFTDKSDVYGFGVVLVELLTGQKPICSTRSQEGRSLVTYFIQSMEQNCLFDTIDSRVAKQARKEEIKAVANLSKRCLNLKGKFRPSMKEVAVELERIQMSQKAFDIQQNNAEVEHDITDVTESWDVVSISTESSFSSSRASRFDEQLLLSNKTL